MVRVDGLPLPAGGMRPRAVPRRTGADGGAGGTARRWPGFTGNRPRATGGMEAVPVRSYPLQVLQDPHKRCSKDREVVLDG